MSVFGPHFLNVWTSEGIGKVTSVHSMHFLTGMPAGCMHFSILCSWFILVLSVLLLILDFSRDTAVGFATTLSLPVLGRLREQVVPNTVTRFLFYAMQKLNFEKGKTPKSCDRQLGLVLDSCFPSTKYFLIKLFGSKETLYLINPFLSVSLLI